MAARLTLEVEIPGWTVAQLRQAIHDLDTADAGSKPDAIAPENVKAEHVMGAIYVGDLGVHYEVLFDVMEDL